MSHEIAQQAFAIAVAEDQSEIDCWIARPTAPGRYPAVIVGMELFGVNEHIRDVSARVARLGYVAIAPNFYHRTLPNDSLPFGDEGRDRGFKQLHAMTRPNVLADVRAVLGYLHTQPDVSEKTGFIGFSMGGYIAFLAATQFDIAACACVYGGWLHNPDIALNQPDLAVTLAPGIARHNGKIIYFVGELDHAIPPEHRTELARQLAAANVRHEVVVYPGKPHGYFCELRDTFDEEARDNTWRRVQQLFAEELA
ncbi:dienelactone hydrolase family protein [Silvimonas sp.]|uniref:dienelactone hydrolase family protein n=1 Tax=Silvimonas sp. TaxID=2650811 RepID=UPI00283B05D6|nr:dienelactone hydrolase family protein [Silvimonas sp.]MDR3426147.1 dienelactone hydrolase family protein [Silvimonas sp.]